MVPASAGATHGRTKADAAHALPRGIAPRVRTCHCTLALKRCSAAGGILPHAVHRAAPHVAQPLLAYKIAYKQGTTAAA